MLIVSEEIVRLYAKKARVPYDTFRNIAEEFIVNSDSSMTWTQAAQHAFNDFEYRRKISMKERMAERRRIPETEVALTLVAKELEDVNWPSAVSLYDADWDGMGCQAILNKYCPQLQNHWITYHKREPAINFVRDKKPKDVLFLGYEPHEELEEVLKVAEKVKIFGSHIRPDMRQLTSENWRIRYFNMMDAGLGERPVTFVMWRAIRRMHGGIDSYSPYPAKPLPLDFAKELAIPAMLGNYGYGWAALAKHISSMSGVNYESRKLRKITEKFMRLVAYDHNNATKVVKALTEAKNLNSPSIKEAIRYYRKLGLDAKYEDSLDYTLGNYEIIGDTAIFPLRGWETTKPFTFKLRSIARMMHKDIAIIVDCNDPPTRKISMRTAYVDDERFNFAKLLEETYKLLPPEVDRNFGAHQTAGGAVFQTEHQSLFFKKLLEIHFHETEQNEEIVKLQEHDLFFE